MEKHGPGKDIKNTEKMEDYRKELYNIYKPKCDSVTLKLLQVFLDVSKPEITG